MHLRSLTAEMVLEAVIEAAGGQEATVKKAEYEELQALLGYELAVADLKRIIGSYTGC
jgi:hypothetical protein